MLRNPATTRSRILRAAAAEFHRQGLRAASLDSVLTTAGVTKGALYHHFSSKAHLARVVLREHVREAVIGPWLRRLAGTDDPVPVLVELARWAEREATPQRLELGCPLNNLALELSAVDEELRQEIAAVFADWRAAVSEALSRGQQRGTVRGEVEPDSVAAFLVAAWEGSIGLVQCTRDRQVLRACRRGLERFLDTLRPE